MDIMLWNGRKKGIWELVEISVKQVIRHHEHCIPNFSPELGLMIRLPDSSWETIQTPCDAIKYDFTPRSINPSKWNNIPLAMNVQLQHPTAHIPAEIILRVKRLQKIWEMECLYRFADRWNKSWTNKLDWDILFYDRWIEFSTKISK